MNNANPSPVYVINLKRSTDRLANFDRSMTAKGVAYVRIAAVDARALSERELYERYDAVKNKAHYFSELKPSEIACFLSHRKAWSRFLDETTQPYAVFLEDDVELTVSSEELNTILAEIAWDSAPMVVKLYQSKGRMGRQLKKVGRFNIFEPFLPPLGTQAQVINRQAAKLLLDQTEKFFEPLDVAMQRWWDMGIRVLVLRPNLIEEVSEKVGGSTLVAVKRQSFRNRVTRELRRPIFRVLKFIRSFFGRRKALII